MAIRAQSLAPKGLRIERVMRPQLLSILMRLSFGIALIAFILHFTPSLFGAERFPWLSDLDQAREVAAQDNKPLLIVFRCEP